MELIYPISEIMEPSTKTSQEQVQVQQFIAVPVIEHGPSGFKTRPEYVSEHGIILGRLQISLGICSMILWCASIGYGTGVYPLGHGIWCGVFFIIAGGLTIGAAKSRNNNCLVG